jgi:hypothetical protein
MTNLVTSDMALFLPRADARPDVDVVLINPPVPNLVFYAPLVRAEQGLPTPRSMRTLAVSQRQPMVITVLDTQTIRVSSTLPFEDPLHRDNIGFPFKVGDVVRLKGTTITIDKINADGSPMEVRFKFDGGLSDPRWRFYIWRTDGYALFQMPQPGGAVTVPSVAYGELLKQAARAFKARQAQPPPG